MHVQVGAAWGAAWPQALPEPAPVRGLTGRTMSRSLQQLQQLHSDMEGGIGTLHHFSPCACLSALTGLSSTVAAAATSLPILTARCCWWQPTFN